MAWEPIRYAQNGDVSIAYTVGGDGPVDVLFIGGFVSHLEIFAELPLAQRFWERMGSFARIISFDKRGMGLSDREAGAYTLENVVGDALAVLDALRAERVVVFGVSEGDALRRCSPRREGRPTSGRRTLALGTASRIPATMITTTTETIDTARPITHPSEWCELMIAAITTGSSPLALGRTAGGHKCYDHRAPVTAKTVRSCAGRWVRSTKPHTVPGDRPRAALAGEGRRRAPRCRSQPRCRVNCGRGNQGSWRPNPRGDSDIDRRMQR